MKKFFMVALAAMSLGVMQSSAAILNGTVSFSGNVVTPVAPGDTTITFSALPLAGGPIGQITASNGDLSAPFNSQVFAISGLTLGPNVNGYTLNFNFAYFFVASSFDGPSLVNGAGNALAVTLNGTFFKNTDSGTDSGNGTVTFTLQNPQTEPEDSYSASGSTVPEPSTYAMLGSALLGLGLLRRRKA